jgi:hypothetical protein
MHVTAICRLSAIQSRVEQSDAVHFRAVNSAVQCSVVPV